MYPKVDDLEGGAIVPSAIWVSVTMGKSLWMHG